jgi:hypothetical protein
MATILEFRRRGEGEVESARHAEGSLGEIIIFPGVRIERRPQVEIKGTRRSAPRRRAQRRKK